MEKPIPIVCIVAALYPQMGIGYRGTLPWKLSNEIKYFRQVTTSTFSRDKSNAVIMGRHTWDSIPAKFRPLKGRINVVLSQQFPSFQKEEGCNRFISNSLSDAISSLRKFPIERIYIIGGSKLYTDSIDIATHWLVTHIHLNSTTTPLPIDTFLPSFTHHQEASPEQLVNFLPKQVQLPHLRTMQYGNHHYYVQDNFTYWFALYTNIQT